LARLRAGGCVAEVSPTEKRGDAERMAASASSNYFDAIAVAGGDGTINEALNGMTQSPLPLGLIPMGTANVLAAEIGLDVTPDAVARTLLDGHRRRIDVGKADGRRFVMMAGVGFDADVVKGIDPKLKRAVGKGAYVWQSLVEMLRYRPQTFRLTVDGVEHMAASAVFANGHFYAGRFTCAPDARLTDGQLHVCLFKASGRLSIVRYGLALMLGTLHRRRDIEILPASQIAIAGAMGSPVHGDGDILAALPLDVRMDETGVELIVPAAFMAN
jgi:YegS/Rv2252/BmrU family lipid kinase